MGDQPFVLFNATLWVTTENTRQSSMDIVVLDQATLREKPVV